MKKIKVYIGDSKMSDELDDDIWKDPDKYVGQHIIVISPETFPKIFTKERIKLLKALEKKPGSINELAAMLDRPMEAVSRDVNHLSGFGLVEVKDIGRERVPTRSASISVSM